MKTMTMRVCDWRRLYLLQYRFRQRRGRTSLPALDCDGLGEWGLLTLGWTLAWEKRKMGKTWWDGDREVVGTVEWKSTRFSDLSFLRIRFIGWVKSYTTYLGFTTI